MFARTAFCSLSIVAAACAGPAAAAMVPEAASPVIETGVATWYGARHSHRFTTSGERFQPWKLTAAHRNLPLGTLVRVTDLSTGRSVIVKVNDREPPHGERCIDLSEGAARALGIRSQGVADVRITALAEDEAVEVAEAPDPTPPPVKHRNRAARK